MTSSVGGLLGAELRRFRHRRFVVGLLTLSLLVLAAGLTVAAVQHRKLGPADLELGRQRAAQFVQEQRAALADCLKQVPSDQDPAQFCGGPLDPAAVNPADFIEAQTFVLSRQLPDGAVGIGVLTATVLFLIGATWVGAEWSTRSMVALLFWEPRRTRVVASKLAVLVGAAAVIATVAQALWWGAAEVLARTRGTTAGLPGDFYVNVLQTSLRAVLFGVLMAALGFALANLVRNTGAALGIAFAYLIVVENAVRALRPHWQGSLLTTNAAALLDPAGARYYLQDSRRGIGYDAGREVVVSHLHGGLVLGGVTLALVLLGSLLFVRRDLH